MFRHGLFAAAAALAISVASAGQADGGFIVYKVGAAPECPFHTVQEAVDAAAASGTDCLDRDGPGLHRPAHRRR